MPEARYAFAATMTLLVGTWCGGCGKATQAKPDGGDGSLLPGDALGPGRHSFDVIAALSSVDGGSPPPAANTFTLVIDVDAGVAIAGGSGRAAVFGITSRDGRTFRSTGSFSAGDPGGSTCGGPQDVRYDQLEVTVAAGMLTGTASGVADISCGDCSFTAPFTARLAGTPDSTPPTLHLSGAVPASPFDTINLTASEPLPASATARLVGADGTGIDLIPAFIDGIIPMVVGYSKPDVVLRAGQAYFVSFDGLVDFAGHVDPSGTPLGLASFPAAPTVAADGFESATGATLGGAMVMTASGALPPIAGNTSLYIGTMNAPALDQTSGRSLMVRLARPAGETTLLFSYRIVSWQSPSSFGALSRVGSEGASTGQPVYSFEAALPTTMLTIGGQTAYASAVGTMTVALPADATDQVLVNITPTTFSCGPRPLINAGLLIDDLRLQ